MESVRNLPLNKMNCDFRILILREIYNSNITLEDLKGFINADALTEKIDNYPMPRTCTQCGKGMNEGYCFEEAAETFCSDECLRANGVTEEEMEQYFKDDVGYWTDWEKELTDEDRSRGHLTLF